MFGIHAYRCIVVPRSAWQIWQLGLMISNFSTLALRVSARDQHTVLCGSYSSRRHCASCNDQAHACPELPKSVFGSAQCPGTTPVGPNTVYLPAALHAHRSSDVCLATSLSTPSNSTSSDLCSATSLSTPQCMTDNDVNSAASLSIPLDATSNDDVHSATSLRTPLDLTNDDDDHSATLLSTPHDATNDYGVLPAASMSTTSGMTTNDDYLLSATSLCTTVDNDMFNYTGSSFTRSQGGWFTSQLGEVAALAPPPALQSDEVALSDPSPTLQSSEVAAPDPLPADSRSIWPVNPTNYLYKLVASQSIMPVCV